MQISKFTNRITDVWDYPKLSIYNNQAGNQTEFFGFLDKPPVNNDIRLYIHVPYCDSFCSFCQFYKEAYPKDINKVEGYFHYVEQELRKYAKTEFFKNAIITSIFFGGGDPSIIPYHVFERLMNCIQKKFNLADKVSFSIEGNVRNLLDEERLQLYKKYNVTRISFGIQTFDEALRRKLLLKPTLEQIYSLTELLHRYSFESFAFDLMYDLPDQTEEILENDIRIADSLNSEYIDFYSLNLYPNTKFFKDIYESNKYEIKPSKQKEHLQNVLIHKKMSELGYKQVISCTYSKVHNWPHPGLHHFLKNGNMLGIGPSARSYLDGHAFRNVCSIEKYVEFLRDEVLPIETGNVLCQEEIDRRQIIFDVNLLKVPMDRVRQFPDIFDKIEQLIELGYMEPNQKEYYLTEEGRAWVGNIQKCFFSSTEAGRDVKNFLKAVKAGQSAYNQDYMSVKE